MSRPSWPVVGLFGGIGMGEELSYRNGWEIEPLFYGVETKTLNRAVRRNASRFPKDFVFQLTRPESKALRYQFGTLTTGRGEHRKYLQWVFTEHGAIMAANVLNSSRAVQMSV